MSGIFGEWVEPDPASPVGRRLAAYRRKVEIEDGVRPALAPRPRKPRNSISGTELRRILNQTKLQKSWSQGG